VIASAAVSGTVSQLAARALVAALALWAAATLGCASDWERTRRAAIDPVHGLLHHAYPEAFQDGNPASLKPFFDEAAGGEALAASLALLEGFAKVEHGTGYIERVDFEARPVRAWLQLRLEGVGHDGALRSLEQRKELELVQRADGWRIVSDRSRPARSVPAPSSYFVDEASLRGLWLRHEGKDKLDPEGRPRRYVYGSGVAALDVDADGWDDLLFARGGGLELFRNDEGRFDRVSEAWGLAGLLADGDPRILNAVIPADFDNDGRVDLFVGAEFGQPLLLRNTGARFEPVADSGLHTDERTISAVAADFDGDGALDLFLANHEDEFRRAPNPPWSKNARADQLFLGNGDGSFRDVTRRAGVGNRGWSLTPVAADYDGDGDVDLFVGNDFGSDVLFRNEGGARFEEVSEEVGVDAPVASMGADWGDYDGDGDLDLFVGGMASNAGWVLEVPDFEIRKVPRVVDWMFRSRVRDYVRAWFRGNRFYENQGDGRFVEVAHERGVGAHGWSWATVWLDFDNDAQLDLYALNGFITGALEDDL